MNRLYCLIILLCSTAARAQQVKKTDTTFRVRYDHSALRIPGKNFALGLIVPAQGRKPTDTIGYPGKKSGWSKYRLTVDSGSFSGGKVKLKRSAQYKKGDSVTVSVYARKWLLGGKGKFLVSRKIPYNYEDSLTVLTNGNASRSPGDHVKFGVRTTYNNKQFDDQWITGKKKSGQRFVFAFNGGHLSKSKGDLKIDPDPTHITNDRVRLVAMLAKDTAIRDTISLMLDYTAKYTCPIKSKSTGHNLAVTADVFYDSLIHATLLRVDILDSTSHQNFHYLVNTSGGSLAISSKGADGMDGRNGLDGSAGLDGAAGTESADVETTTAADGTTQTTTTMTQGPGGNGSDGGNGDNGEDGDNGANGGNIVVRYTAAVTPFLARIKATSLPGAGGSGGRGGSGGAGGSGGQGNPSGSAGSRGSDGRNGFDGASGKAGRTSFILTPQ